MVPREKRNIGLIAEDVETEIREILLELTQRGGQHQDVAHVAITNDSNISPTTVVEQDEFGMINNLGGTYGDRRRQQLRVLSACVIEECMLYRLSHS